MNGYAVLADVIDVPVDRPIERETTALAQDAGVDAERCLHHT